MSQYLKGDEKEAVLDLINHYIALRLTNQEIIAKLHEKGFEISARTLRRYKSELRQTAGETMSDVFLSTVIDHMVEDILTFRELQRVGWKEYDNTTVPSEKLRALALVRNATMDKFKIFKCVPLKFSYSPFKKRKDISIDYDGVDSQNLAN
jgi:hypothetical protein